MATDIFAIGELLIDFVEKGKNEVNFPIISAYPGGAPGNFLAFHAIYGQSCKLLASVGDDDFGKILIDTMRDLNIDTQFIEKTPDHFTTLAFVTLDSGGNRSFSFARKPGADTFIRCDKRVLKEVLESEVLHFGSLSLTDEPAKSSTKKIVEYALENNVWVNYDPNYRELLWKDEAHAIEEMKWGLSHANSIKISEEELALIFGEDEELAISKLTELKNFKFAFITRGAHGVSAVSKSARIDVEGLSLDETIDTTGAGDIFGACAIYFLMKNLKDLSEFDKGDLRSACEIANFAAALSTTKHGAITSIPKRDELLKFLEKNYFEKFLKYKEII